MHPLQEYLTETGLSLDEFARAAGVASDVISDILSGESRPSASLAQRIADITGGAVSIDDSSGAADVVVNARGAFAGSAPEIDESLLAEILSETLATLLGGARRKGDNALPRLAAEAAANTYAALSMVTSRQGVDRLAQALRPVLLEILAESFGSQSDHPSLEAMSIRASELYFQARQQTQRG
jgi:transcriptional regulator with XRE-family HTH domain